MEELKWIKRGQFATGYDYSMYVGGDKYTLRFLNTNYTHADLNCVSSGPGNSGYFGHHFVSGTQRFVTMVVSADLDGVLAEALKIVESRVNPR